MESLRSNSFGESDDATQGILAERNKTRIVHMCWRENTMVFPKKMLCVVVFTYMCARCEPEENKSR